jgi:hypothetical protein
MGVINGPNTVTDGLILCLDAANVTSYPGSDLWTPSRLSTSLWYDAADSSTITVSGSTVSQWNDKSGNAFHISQTTDASRPVLTTNAQNGRNVITFDGVNDILFTDVSAGLTGSTSVSIISVFRQVSGGATEDIQMGVGQTDIPGQLRSFYRTNNSTTLGFGGWSRDVATSSVSLDIGGGYHIFSTWNTSLVNTDNVVIGRDGVYATFSNNTGNLSLSYGGFSVGSMRGSSVGNYYSNIQVGEILVFNSVISTANRQLIEGYLAGKWGLQSNLPSDHPYRNSWNTWFDLSGNNNNGTLVNGPSYSSDNLGIINFDGVNDHASINNAATLNFSTALTISFWFFSGTTHSYLYLKGRTDVDNYNPYLRTNGYYTWTGGNGRSIFNPPAGFINSNTWYNITVTHISGNDPQIYRNGVLATGYTYTEGNGTFALGTNSNPVSINADIPRGIIGTFDGKISVIMAHARAITASEVLQNFNSLKSRFGL